MQSETFIGNVNDKPLASPATGTALSRILVWDLPLRIFHWLLVAAVTTAVITGEIGGSWIDLHAKAGLTIVGLVSFRLVWGLIGSTHARFLHFAPTLKRIRTYLDGKWHGVGHNPLGAISVFALLALLSIQAGTGLFSNDDIDFTGPLFSLVDQAWSNRLTGWHQLLANILLGLIALHIVAITFYLLFKKKNLVKPMVTGWKEGPADKSATKGGWVALIVSITIALTVVYAVSGTFLKHTPPAPAPAATHAPAW